MASAQPWQWLPDDECMALLRGRHLGRVGFTDDHGPFVLPVNYVVDHGGVLFRSDAGTPLVELVRDTPVAFEVDEIDDATRTGWSVVVRGTAVAVTDQEEITRIRSLPLHPWIPGLTGHYVRVRSHTITGRRVRLPLSLPANWLG